MTAELVTYAVDDRVGIITLNRPDKLNAFTGDMIDAWQASLAVPW